MSFNTPVVLMCFNRPDLTRVVMERISLVQPSVLLVICDGARSHVKGEAERVEETRAIALNPSWDCKVHSNLSGQNLGCKKRISSGLDWVFSLVNTAIIVEDDCLIDTSFFYWAEKMLQQYESDSRIFHISAQNLYPIKAQLPDNTFFYSKYSLIWGWATWARAWKNYDVNMLDWNKKKKAFEDSPLFEAFDSVYQGKIDTWDYQWVYTLLKNDALALVPSRNLVENLGFREDATHTLDVSSPMSRLVAQKLGFPIEFPSMLKTNEVYDKYLEGQVFGQGKKEESFWGKIRGLIASKFRG